MTPIFHLFAWILFVLCQPSQDGYVTFQAHPIIEMESKLWIVEMVVILNLDVTFGYINYVVYKLTSLDLSISSVRCTLSIGVILMRSLHQGHPRTPMNFRTFFCMQRMAMSWVYNGVSRTYNKIQYIWIIFRSCNIIIYI